MTLPIRGKWVMVGLLWVGVLCLNYRNIGAMHEIQDARQRNVFLKMDEQFLERHMEEIEKSQKAQQSLYHTTEALSLGLLTMETTLRDLGERFGFSEMDVKTQRANDQGDSVPVVFGFRGSLRNTVSWLEALRRDYPFLPVTRISVEVEQQRGWASCEALLQYRYKLADPEGQP